MLSMGPTPNSASSTVGTKEGDRVNIAWRRTAKFRYSAVSFIYQFIIFYLSGIILSLFSSFGFFSLRSSVLFEVVFYLILGIYGFGFLIAYKVLLFGINKYLPSLIPRIIPFYGAAREQVSEEYIFRDYLTYESGHSEQVQRLSDRIRVIRSIDDRIDVLRLRASILLFTIGSLLIAAVLIIIFAGTLTGLDASAVNDIDRLDSTIGNIESKMSTLSDIAFHLKSRDAIPSVTNERDQIQKKLDSLPKLDPLSSSQYFGFPKTLDGVNALLRSAEARLEIYKNLQKDAWEKEIKSVHGYADTKYLVATAVTRIGVVLVIVFLVQILMGLYRYTTRLVTYYSARRDLIQIWNGELQSLGDLEKILTPSIEFGKEPKHPIEDIVNSIIAKIPKFGVSEGNATTNNTAEGKESNRAS